MVGWHHWPNGHEFEQAPGDSGEQRKLAWCSPWGHKSQTRLSDWTNKRRQRQLTITSSYYAADTTESALKGTAAAAKSLRLCPTVSILLTPYKVGASVCILQMQQPKLREKHPHAQDYTGLLRGSVWTDRPFSGSLLSTTTPLYSHKVEFSKFTSGTQRKERWLPIKVQGRPQGEDRQDSDRQREVCVNSGPQVNKAAEPARCRNRMGRTGAHRGEWCTRRHSGKALQGPQRDALGL